MGRFQESKVHERPYVILNAAMTLDGKIATVSGDSRISSETDLEELHRLRSDVDAVMIGIGTELGDDPLLTVRRVKGKNPVRVIVDSFARTPIHSRLLKVRDGGRVILGVSESAPSSRIRRLEEAGINVIRCGKRKVDLNSLLERLHRLGIKRLLLEGGGNLNWSFLAARLVDEVHVTVAPLVVGGKEATTLVEGPGITDMDGAIRLSLRDVSRCGEEVVLVYSVK